jgi:predicted nucleic acid-binding protein
VILVDTSVWVLAGRGRRPIRDFVDAADVVICPPIAQELLQGAHDEDRFRSVQRVVAGLEMLDDAVPFIRYAQAAEIYVRCREAGYTIRSSVDCLIAATALAYDATLVHNDRDFGFIAEVVPLKVLKVA